MSTLNGTKRIKIETVTNDIMAINTGDDQAPVGNRRIEEELMVMNGKFDFVCNELQDLRKDHATLRSDFRALINMHSETNVLLRELITKVAVPNNPMSAMYSRQLVDSQPHLHTTAYHTMPMHSPQLPTNAQPAAMCSTRRIVRPAQSQIQTQSQHQLQQDTSNPARVRVTKRLVRVGRLAARTTPPVTPVPSVHSEKSSEELVFIDDDQEVELVEEENLLEEKISTLSSTSEELSIMDINLSDDDFFNRVSSQISTSILSSGVSPSRYLIEILDSLMTRELQGKFVWTYKTKGSKLEFNKHPNLIALIHQTAKNCDPNYNPAEGQRKIKTRFQCGDRTSSQF